MPVRRSILILDRDPAFRRNAGRFLSDRGFEVVEAPDVRAGLAELRASQPAFVLLDLGYQEPPGLELLETLLGAPEKPQVICVSGEAKVSDVVTAVKSGALDVLERPVDGERLVAILNHAAEVNAGEGGPSVSSVPRPVALDKEIEFDFLVTESPAMQSVLRRIEQVAGEAAVLLEGEPGVGKGAVARYFHSVSPRNSGPLAVVAARPKNCTPEEALFGSADTTSAFAEAKGGVVLIDAIFSLGESGQERLSKLLQGLSAARVSGAEVRWPPMVTGMDRPLSDEVSAGRIRGDLAQVFGRNLVSVPPLRDRREDIPELVRRVVAAVQHQVGASGATISHEVMSELVRRDWPGNIPELARTVRDACCMGEAGILTVDLNAKPEPRRPEAQAQAPVEPEPTGWVPTLDPHGDVQPYDVYEAEIFRFALKNAGGCVSRAAELLGVGRATMYRKMRAYTIEVPPVSERAIARSRGARKRRKAERQEAEARRAAAAAGRAAS